MRGTYNLSSWTLSPRAMASEILKKILFPFACVYAVGSLIFMYLFFPLLIIPIHVYKYTIMILAKIFLPGCKMLDGLDNIMAHGTVYSHKGLYIPLQLNFEGHMDYQDFLAQWEKNVMTSTKKDGSLKFPELKCCIKTWKGYSFYKEDKDFSLKNHIKLYENPESNSIINREKIDRIRMKFVSNLINKKRSPWEVLIVHNYRNIDDEDGKEFTVVILKIHHCLADGYATLLMFWEAFASQKLGALSKPRAASLKTSFINRQKTILSAVYSHLAFMMRTPFYLIYDRDVLYEKSEWHNNKHKSDVIEGTLRPIGSADIKEVSRLYNVSITTVLTGVCTGGFRRMMAAKGLKSPKSIHTSLSLPLPNHPPRLTTHSFVTDFEVPIAHSNLDDHRRLKLIERNMKSSVLQSLLITANIVKPFFSMPVAVSGKITEMACFDSMSLSTVPLPPPDPPSGVEVVGGRLVQAYNTCELSFLKNISASFFFLKYKDNFFALAGIQRYLLTDEKEIYDIEKYMAEELKYLLSQPIV